MAIPINEFELYVADVNLLKGLEYIKKGVVGPVQKLDEGQLLAEIVDDDVYKVELWISDDKVVRQSCTCGYTLGPICKHAAAVLLRLQRGK
jgi:uncharacterized Zn finger protein